MALEGWNLKEGKAKSFECSGVVLFGGFENVGANSVLSRKFTNLPPHFMIMIKFAFWKVKYFNHFR